MKSILLLLLFALSSNATAQTQTQNPNYFKEVGQMLGEMRSMKWFTDICSESFPETAEKNSRAYASWFERHHALIDEIEGQFFVIEAYWKSLSPTLQTGAVTREQFNAMVDAQREQVVKEFLAQDKVRIQRTCTVLPLLLTSEKYDLMITRAESIAIIRKGPK